MKKLLFQTISWGGSRYLKVVNPHVWYQYEVLTQFLNLTLITPSFRGWGQICPPYVSKGFWGFWFQILVTTSYLTQIDTRQKDLQLSDT